MNEPLIEVRDLKKYFHTPKGALHAVDGVNLAVAPGTTLGIVGESGCGKSTLGRLMLRLIEPTAGEVYFHGDDILSYSPSGMKEMRRKMQIIFQDPYSSLNPRMTVSEIIGEPIKVNGIASSRDEIDDRVDALMATVGLDARFANSYPHELDGGRRQRIGVARALSVDPEFIVCDEPVSALDVSIQAQILNLLMDLQDERKLTYLFITHNLSVVKHISHNVAVMYLGQCVEYASTEELFKNPMHPYTRALLDAIPVPRLRKGREKRTVIRGEVTNPIDPPPGCRFAARCPLATEKCRGESIPLIQTGPGHSVACVLYM